MSFCSVSSGPALCMGDLRPSSPALASSVSCLPASLPGSAPAPRSALCYVTLPHSGTRFLPGFANFRGFRPPPARSPVSSGSKNKKFSPPAAAPRERLRRRGKKVSIHAEKPLCIVHNGFFLFVWKCFFVFFHPQVFQRPVTRIILRHEFPAPLLHNL